MRLKHAGLAADGWAMDLGRRKRERKRAGSAAAALLKLDDGREVRVRVLDTNEAGAGVACGEALKEGAWVWLGGKRARVRWSLELAARDWRAGLVFETADIAAPLEVEEDCYEALQVSPNADQETIQRVFRLLAQRYHPDNQETGNEEQFKRLLAAFRVLSDAEKRAAYDAHRVAGHDVRWKIFDRFEATQGREAEIRKRQGILGVLHARRMADPEQAFLTLHELEKLLACPKEHLAFALWYLRETGCVARSDNGRYAITAKGVDQAEAEAPASAPGRLLLEQPVVKE